MMDESDPGSPLRKAQGSGTGLLSAGPAVVDSNQFTMTMLELPPSGASASSPPADGQAPILTASAPESTTGTVSPAAVVVPTAVASPPVATPVVPTLDPTGVDKSSALSSTEKMATAATAHPVRAPSLPVSWFFMHTSGKWSPFSRFDSSALELAHKTGNHDAVEVTDGGRYRVNIKERTRTPVYWEEPANDVRRASWFLGHEELKPMPENDAALIEDAFAAAWVSQTWHKQVTLPNGDLIELRNENFFVLFPANSSYATGTNDPNEKVPPRILRRGYPQHIAPGEERDRPCDHCVLVIPGFMSEQPLLSSLGFLQAENMRGTLVDCVDTMRIAAQEIISKNFETTDVSKSSGRVEFLPILWASADDNDAAMEDAALLQDLGTIKNLRNFFSKQLLDCLCYYSEAQQALANIAREINKAVKLFTDNNPTFSGSFHLVGHGIGGCLVTDILACQGMETSATSSSSNDDVETSPKSVTHDSDEDVDTDAHEDEPQSDSSPISEQPSWQELLKDLGLEEFIEVLEKEDADLDTLRECSDSDYKEFGFNLGQRKKVIKAIKEMGESQQKALDEAQKAQEAEKIKRDARRAEKRLEKRKKAAEEAEQAAKAQLDKLTTAQTEKPSRARQYTCPSLNFEPQNCFLFGCPLGLLVSLQPRNDKFLNPTTKFKTCARVFNVFHPYDPMAYRLEPLTCPELGASKFPPSLVPHHAGSKRMHLEFKDYVKATSKDLKKEVSTWASSAWNVFKEKVSGASGADNAPSPPPATVDALPMAPSPAVPKSMGALNNQERIDWQIQEDPLEIINESLRSMNAHSSYWGSLDAAFFIVNRIYKIE